MSMNKLHSDKQKMVIAALVEGSSIRSTERMTGVHRDTITRLMVRVGNACKNLMDQKMVNLTCKDIQVDEIWCYVGKKQAT
jgi:DNA-directed RNA polymerase specialized sigma24 family protein